MKVYTLTPNPALDLSGQVEDLVVNEKNYVARTRRDPGGNGINAARIAHRLGAWVEALGFLGGAAGEEIQGLLKHEGVRTRFIRIQGSTRVNVTVTNQSTHQQTRLTFPGPTVRSAELKKLRAQVSGLRGPGIFILGGSTPVGCPDHFHAEIARRVAAHGLDVIVDVPARYFRDFVSRQGSEICLLKPNLAELEEWAGRKLRTDSAVVGVARKMLGAGRVRRICVSLGARGAILVSQKDAFFGASPRVKARGTVGAGDSMVGAVGATLARGGDWTEALSWGLAAGAATAEAAGTQLADPAEIRRLQKKVRIKNLAC